MLLFPPRFTSSVVADVPLEAPTILSTATANADDNGIASGTINPTAGSKLFTFQASRHTSSRTHNAPTVTGTLVMGAAWTLVEDFSVLEAASSAHVHGSVWWAPFVSGSGTIEQDANANTFQRILSVMQIIGAKAAPVRQVPSPATHDTGASLACSMAAAPLSTSLGISFMGCRLGDASITDPAGYSQLLDSNPFSGGTQSVIHYKLGTPSQNVTYSGLINAARGLINFEIEE